MTSDSSEEGTALLPRARTKDLIVQELADETLVYDLKRHKARCLNQAAAAIWRSCDGKKTALQIATIVQRQLGLPADEGLVQMALDRLQRARLLDGNSQLPAKRKLRSRRDIARALGIAIIAVPLVMTVVAPTAALAASCIPCGSDTHCTSDAQCCPGCHCKAGRQKCA